jgi:hypothetical protein
MIVHHLHADHELHLVSVVAAVWFPIEARLTPVNEGDYEARTLPSHR